MPYLPYHEPNITTILSLTSFLLLLNSVRYILDQLLYCGIIGEILIGIIWGLPVGGTSWLSTGTQEAIQAYGYLGLIGLVFEGGLKTDLTLLKKSVYLSILVATIGLLMPIGLSFILLAFPFTSSAGMLYPTPLAAFSAGASLCSTSLGTTFAILASAEMQKTKVGVVLVGAAMMDDVVGLVMVNIVTTLGAGGSGGWPIARPIAGSFGMFLVTLLLGSYVLKPAWTVVLGYLRSDEESSTKLQSAIRKLVEKIPHMGFILSTAVLVIYVTIAAFIDSSVLFAAFIAGGVVNFLWSFRNEHEGGDAEGHGSSAMYESYYQAPMDYILVPFFFASIGFSIPITDMFRGSIFWKGIVYAILMIIAKAAVGIVVYASYYLQLPQRRRKAAIHHRSRSETVQPGSNALLTSGATPGLPHAIALLVGLAMTARGEIGFLIASLSQSSATLTFQEEVPSAPGEDIFLVIVWAVVICTIAGPVGVGIVVRHIRRQDGAMYGDWI